MQLHRLYIDLDEGRELGLNSEQVMVLAAVRYLSRDTPWKQNNCALGEAVCCSRDKAKSRIDELIAKGLLIEDNGYLSCANNSQSCAKNSQSNARNSQLNAKNSHSPTPPLYNIINNKEDCISEADASDTLSQNLKKKRSLTNWKKLPIPDWDELLEYGKEKNYSRRVIEDFYSKMETVGWLTDKGLPVINWKAYLHTYYLRDQTYQARMATQFQAGTFRPRETRETDQQRAMAARAAEEKAMEKARRAAEDEAYSDEDRQANMALIARLAGRLGG